MKKVNVIVKDKTLLELVEPADKGDLIDLKEVVQVDTSYLDMLIESGKEKAYESKLSEVEKRLKTENQSVIDKLNSKIDLLNKDNLRALENKEHEVENKYKDIIADYKKQLDVLKETQQSQIDKINSDNEAAKSKIIQEDKDKYSELLKDYELLKSQLDGKIEQTKSELTNKYERELEKLKADNLLSLSDKDKIIQKKDYEFELEKSKVLDELKEKYEAIIREKDDKINNLQHAKASMNVKQTGEDLEAWCDNEVNSYMQNGLFNCTWEKDNKVIRDENETKGSKADYIFKVYASESHLDNELLASVCMDMKDENPDSVNKKTNSDYYKQLDKNREKKNCKYALLVSNLEMDKPNVLPIFKVREYEDMYVVRPAYLMTFLNMIASLTTRFTELILSQGEEEFSLKDKLTLVSEFEDIKNTYLDKPLASLESAISEITNNTDKIRGLVQNIDNQCEKINTSYINKIQSKINNFELKLNRQVIKKIKE